jgi:ubiquinone/menaquinone biosynthesis C-methylase UbiE
MPDSDDLIAGYNRTAKHYARTLEGRADAKQLAAFAAKLQPGAKVADIGCAAGRDTQLLADAGLNPVGVDLSVGLLEIARAKHPHLEFVLGDLRSLPFPNASLGGAWVSAVLHHVPTDQMPAAIAELARVLQPAGILYIHTKAGTGALSTQEEGVQGMQRSFALVSESELGELLQRAGLDVASLYSEPSNSRPGLMWVNAFAVKSAELSKK